MNARDVQPGMYVYWSQRWILVRRVRLEPTGRAFTTNYGTLHYYDDEPVEARTE